MARRVLCILLVMTFMLGGCSMQGGSAMEEALAFRSKVLGGCSFLAKITADYGEQVCTFSLSCRVDREGALLFTVTAPDTISGITGRVDGAGGKLTFDDVVLPFSPLAEGRLSPVASAYTAAQSWRTGYIATCGKEGEQLVFSVNTTYEENPLVADTRMDPEKGVPLSTEICYNGRKHISIVFTDFQFSSKAE